MITLSKFERLVVADIPQKPVNIALIGAQGEFLDAFCQALPTLNKHEQYTQLKAVLSDLLIAQMDDGYRLHLINELVGVGERIIAQLHSDYLYEHQSLSDARQESTYEARSLYFLMILIYKNITARAYQVVQSESSQPVVSQGFFARLTGVVADVQMSDAKQILAHAMYQMMRLYVCLLLEYALTYERTPRAVWQQLNFWYLRGVYAAVVRLDVVKSDDGRDSDTIYNQYRQACLASFANFFAYRRQDIVNVFKVLPTWIDYVDTTFEPRPELRVFVNLLGNHPPEVITPYATVNPYSEEFQCLFFDVARLMAYLKDVKEGKYLTENIQSVFEARLARMVLIAFGRRANEDKIDRYDEHAGVLLTGFSTIANELSSGRDMSELVKITDTTRAFMPRSLDAFGVITPIEEVVITTKNNTTTRFNYINERGRELPSDEPLSRNFLQIFGVFALKSKNSESSKPWRLGIAHWVDRINNDVEVDGRFLGRILMMAGVRLRKNEGRSQEFVPAFLIEGDELNEQSTLVLPNQHFKSGDFVILRIDGREMELRLERKLLSTDEIEQYQIVRIDG